MGFFTAFAQGALDKREEIEAAQSDKQAEMQKYMQENLARALELRAADRERARKWNERIAFAKSMKASTALQEYYANTPEADISILMDKTYTTDDKGATIDPKDFGALPALTPAISAEERTLANLQEPERKKAGFVNFLFGIDPNMEANTMGTIGKANNMSEKGVRGLLQQFGTGDFATSAPTRDPSDTSRLMFSKDSSDVQKNTGEIYGLDKYEDPVQAQALIEQLERAKGNPPEQSRIREALSKIRTTPAQQAARMRSSQDQPDVWKTEPNFVKGYTTLIMELSGQSSSFEYVKDEYGNTQLQVKATATPDQVRAHNEEKYLSFNSLEEYKGRFGLRGTPNIYMPSNVLIDQIKWAKADDAERANWVQFRGAQGGTATRTPLPKQGAPDPKNRAENLDALENIAAARLDPANDNPDFKNFADDAEKTAKANLRNLGVSTLETAPKLPKQKVPQKSAAELIQTAASGSSFTPKSGAPKPRPKDMVNAENAAISVYTELNKSDNVTTDQTNQLADKVEAALATGSRLKAVLDIKKELEALGYRF